MTLIERRVYTEVTPAEVGALVVLLRKDLFVLTQIDFVPPGLTKIMAGTSVSFVETEPSIDNVTYKVVGERKTTA